MALHVATAPDPSLAAPDLLGRPEVLDLLAGGNGTPHPALAAAGYDKQAAVPGLGRRHGYGTIDLPRPGARQLLRRQP